MRLTDLYLLYAEALNEKDDVNNRELAISYLDQIRARAGLKGIKESWDTLQVSQQIQDKAGESP